MKWERVEIKDKASEYVSEKRKYPRRKIERGPGRRWGHTVNAMRYGRYVYVFGGYGKEERQSNDVHVFDTIRSVWTKPNVKGSVPSPRDSHTAIAFENKIFIFGGTDGVKGLNDLYTLETTSNTWGKCVCEGELPSPREGHAAARIGNKMYIFGGCGKNSMSYQETYYNDVYMLDTTTYTWMLAKASGKLPSARDSHSCVSFQNKLYVYGGVDFTNSYMGTVFIFDTDTLEWSEMLTSGDIPPPRAGHVAIVIQNFMIVFGGFADEKMLFNDLHFLNLLTGVWEVKTDLELAPLPLPSPSSPISPSLSPSSPSPSLSSLPSPCFSLSCDIIDHENGKILFYGGCDFNLHPLQDMFILHTEIKSAIVMHAGAEEDKNQIMMMSEQNLYQSRKFSEASSDSNASPNAKRMVENKEKIENKDDEYFEGKIIDINPFGYFIETEINKKKLKGFFFAEEREMMKYFKTQSEESMRKVPGKRGRKRKVKPPEQPPITEPVRPNLNHELNFIKPHTVPASEPLPTPITSSMTSSITDPVFKINNEGDCVVLTLDASEPHNQTNSAFVSEPNRQARAEEGEDTDTDTESHMDQNASFNQMTIELN